MRIIGSRAGGCLRKTVVDDPGNQSQPKKSPCKHTGLKGLLIQCLPAGGGGVPQAILFAVSVPG